MPLEGPSTLGEGRLGLQTELGATSLLFSPDVVHWSGRVTRPIDVSTDVAVEGSVARVGDGDSDWRSSAHRGLYALRAGVRHSPLRHVVIGGGLGGGGHAGGGFVSPDLHVTVGYHNRWLVPFLSVDAFYSHPVGVGHVVFFREGESERLRPPATGGGRITPALRLPLAHEAEGTGPALLVGYAWHVLAVRKPSPEVYIANGLSAGFAWTF